jgi:hypothetical protein
MLRHVNSATAFSLTPPIMPKFVLLQSGGLQTPPATRGRQSIPQLNSEHRPVLPPNAVHALVEMPPAATITIGFVRMRFSLVSLTF